LLNDARAQLMNRPPALLGPPVSSLPAEVCGIVKKPGAAASLVVTAQVISVVPRMTRTSPSLSAPATICSAMASMHPDARAGPSASAPPPTVPARHAVGTSRGSWSMVTLVASITSWFQPTQSNSGIAQAAVDVSSTASPHNAWLATACAGQNPAASGYCSMLHFRNCTSSPVSAGFPAPASGVRPRASP
jgi:hypothetical protein